eukprot:scaffold680_cov264-Pinguiococcus_pyrenoidosus.AAC.2
MGVPTSISPSPAGTKILASTPSSCASNPTVALSVSTSQSTSPAAKDAPSSTVQLVIEPDSMVGDSAGRPTTS